MIELATTGKRSQMSWPITSAGVDRTSSSSLGFAYVIRHCRSRVMNASVRLSRSPHNGCSPYQGAAKGGVLAAILRAQSAW
jgi:hypothetical protein